jgi:Na+-translocating ferredoxin:NAD+ oxidoreductase RnfA subunit
MSYIFFDLFSAALYASLLQNFIFTGGYGASEAIRMSAKPKNLFPLSLFIIYFSITTSVICRILELNSFVSGLESLYHYIIFYGVLCVLYILTLAVVLVMRAPKRVVRRVGIAAFNTLVLSVPFINYRAGFNLAGAIGSGIGAGVAFVLAVLLINIGLRKLEQNTSIPRHFKGTPAIFIYVSLLSLGFMALTGKSIFI